MKDLQRQVFNSPEDGVSNLSEVAIVAGQMFEADHLVQGVSEDQDQLAVSEVLNEPEVFEDHVQEVVRNCPRFQGQLKKG